MRVFLRAGINCTLLQISVCAFACAICKCVQCALASPIVPKGKSRRAKTNFFLHQPSINEPILLIRFFNFIIYLILCNSVFLFSIQRFAAWRSGGFLSQMFNRRTELESITKLSYEALHPPLRQTAVGGWFFFV